MKPPACLLVASCLGLVGSACAPHVAAPPHLTSAQIRTPTVPTSPWALYDDAVVDQRHGRAYEAVAHYRLAEERFGASHPHPKSLAIYGRARALDLAGRCDEARAAYQEYARFVGGSDPRSAAMALGMVSHCYTPATVDPTLQAATVAIVDGQNGRALSVIEGGSQDPGLQSPWLAYDRAVALEALGRTDDAVVAYRAAEDAFDDGQPDSRGGLLAVYGRARALVDGYRCREARAAYEEYAALVRPTDPPAADDARRMATACR